MKNAWLENTMPSIEVILSRLKCIFPREIDVKGYIVREIGAKTIYVMLYGFCAEGNAWIRPATITCMTDTQSKKIQAEERIKWLAKMQGRQAPRDIAKRWYKMNTRESIRDETIRDLVRFGAIIEKTELPTTSPMPRYSLDGDFAALFDPSLAGGILDTKIKQWQSGFLSSVALARVALSRQLASPGSDGVLVHLPNGEVRKLTAGPSNELVKSVIETFAVNFMRKPAVILISESSKKLILKDDEICRSIGFIIDVSTVLPDIILVELGGKDAIIIFVECVATDGPIDERRKEELVVLAAKAGYEEASCAFITVFKDRANNFCRKLTPSIAWGTFIWHAAEPKNIIYLHEGTPEKTTILGNLFL